ncbi:aromatic-ring-hydroxylating dioxygenase subunit beta [Streptomyces sp. NPDC059460]|uniref:aromatic-ring-hydroxylating dioxygenase subunit beta n=1 Tax=Streptomyces sp. NPDC059460 TaxID=3346840 RepID=UPI003687C617
MTELDENRATRFLQHEAAALNDERYEDWLAMITEDFDYRMPTPVLRDDPTQPRHSDRSLLAWESIHSLRLRFQRIQTDFAWADRPPGFHRRHVTAVRLGERSETGPGDWIVHSDVLVFRSRAPEGTTITSATRRDVLRLEGDGLKLARRTTYVDLDRVDLAQIALLF